MNNKLTKALLAGAAALAVAAAGTTMAAWSDFGQITNNEVEAGHLKLNLNSTGSINNVNSTAVAPGESHTIDFMVASADLDGVPDANLSMKLINLFDKENGCASNSEAAVDNCAAGDPGEFSGQGYIRVRYTNPAPVSQISFANNNCSAPSGYVNSAGYSPASDNDETHFPRLSGFANADHALGTLAGNEGVCVRVDTGLDHDATNAVQSDSSTFDLQFDLTQTPDH